MPTYVFYSQLHPDSPASLTMVEIAYHSQYHYFQFPRLRTPKTDCSKDQIDAIDDLIDSMDLSINQKESDVARDTYLPDLLPFESLPHIYEQNLMDVLETKIILNASEDDEQFADMLDGKNFVEIFWKVPELREKHAKRAAKMIKSLFPLEENKVVEKPSEASKVKSEYSDSTTKSSSTTNDSALSIERVSVETPADDFRQLVQHNVLTIANRTERDAKFQIYAEQMRNVISELLFESKESLNYKKLEEALSIYRKQCYDFSSFNDYNKWIKEVKRRVIQNQRQHFWVNVVVEKDLGLCFVSTESSETKQALSSFYELASEDME